MAARIFTPLPSLPFGIGGRNRNKNPYLSLNKTKSPISLKVARIFF
jgi:hypothetical protein